MDRGDVDGNGIVATDEWFSGNGTRKLFQLKHRPIHRILDVRVNNNSTRVRYCTDHRGGWIPIFPAPPRGIFNVKISYEYSVSPDPVLAGTYGARLPALYEDAGPYGDPSADWEPWQGGRYPAVALGDVDNDGDPDLGGILESTPSRVSTVQRRVTSPTSFLSSGGQLTQPRRARRSRRLRVPTTRTSS